MRRRKQLWKTLNSCRFVGHVVYNPTIFASSCHRSGQRSVAVDPFYTICSNSRAYANDAAMSFCFGISCFSSPLRANVIVAATRFTSQPRYNRSDELNDKSKRNDGLNLFGEYQQLRLGSEEEQSSGIF